MRWFNLENGNTHITMNINFLKEVAQFIGAKNVEKELGLLTRKTEDCPLVLPLMGEFSSGKTTLINALTDSKQLETATKPTTSTIYEIHFGSENCKAEVYYADNTKILVDSISDLHNDELSNAIVVEVYDTSTKVPQSVVVVDTPGLSSPDPKHKQTLVDFLPEADGILLVSDVNQPGLTRSLSEFIKTMELSKRRIYLVLTKCDTKSAQEVVDCKKYIATNNGIPMQNIVAVSAKDDNLTELLNLLTQIQNEKADILEKVNKERVKNIANRLIDSISVIKKVDSSDEELEDAIAEQERKLKSLNSRINIFIESLEEDIANASRTTERKFEDTIASRLDSLAGSKNVNFDAEATSIVNNTSSMLIANLRSEIYNIVRSQVSNSKLQEDFELSSLESVDLTAFEVGGMSYNLDLNSMGHKYDRVISTGLKITAAVAAAATVVGAAAGAAGSTVGSVSAGAATTGGATAGTGTLIAKYGATDLVVDAAQTAMIVRQNKEQKELSKREQIRQKYNEIEGQNQDLGKKIGTNGGLIESIVGLVTDSTMGKPQRKRAIREYLEYSLMPEFRMSVEKNVKSLVGTIHTSILNDATETLTEIKATLSGLKTEKKAKECDFRAKMKQLDEYRIILKNEYLCGGF